jgi:TolB-like protein
MAEDAGSDTALNTASHAEAAGAQRRVFISYASQDASTAQKVCSALEAAGILCWIAPRDVLAGESYAAAIVNAINSCRMMVLVLSQSAMDSPHVLREVERASSKNRPVLAFRTDTAPLTPNLEYFLSTNHWLDASGGALEPMLPALVTAVRAHDQGQRPGALDDHSAHAASNAVPAPAMRRLAIPLVFGAIAIAAIAYVAVDKFRALPAAPAVVAATPAAATGERARPSSAAPAFAPPAHSIAVLPFVNMSGDPKQDYFSDGLSEELLNSLASVRDLQVAARTSSFSFKGGTDVAEIARKLNVGALLEGSVRKDGNHVRITAQLINAVTGFHLWSQTYDRDLKNVLALQTEIATAVTKALAATLLTDAATAIEIGGTRNPEALDAYLRGMSLDRQKSDETATLARAAAFAKAISLDPKFAKAYVGLSFAQNEYTSNFAPGADVPSGFRQARENAQKAIELAPDLGIAHAALAYSLDRGSLDFEQAGIEIDRALALSPNDAEILVHAGAFYVSMGRTEAGLADIRKGIALDTLNPAAYKRLAYALTTAQQYSEALRNTDRAMQFAPGDLELENNRGLIYLALGNLEAARVSCAPEPRTWIGRLCMCLLLDKLHRRSDAEAMLAAFRQAYGDAASYQYAEIYAQWGDIGTALNWLESAHRLPDPGIISLKTDILIDPLRNEPRFKAVMAALKYPK